MSLQCSSKQSLLGSSVSVSYVKEFSGVERPQSSRYNSITLLLSLLELRQVVVMQVSHHVGCGTVIRKLLWTQLAKRCGSLLVLLNELTTLGWKAKIVPNSTFGFLQGQEFMLRRLTSK